MLTNLTKRLKVNDLVNKEIPINDFDISKDINEFHIILEKIANYIKDKDKDKQDSLNNAVRNFKKSGAEEKGDDGAEENGDIQPVALVNAERVVDAKNLQPTPTHKEEAEIVPRGNHLIGGYTSPSARTLKHLQMIFDSNVHTPSVVEIRNKLALKYCDQVLSSF